MAAAAATPLVRAASAWPGIARPAQAREFRIGHLNTLSGPLAAPAIDLKKGLVAYVKSRGSRIGGRKVRIVDADDALDPATGIRQVRKLVTEDAVDVIVGITYSNVALAVRDLIDELKVPTVVANAAANAITRERRSRYVFRTSYSNWQLGGSPARWCAQRFPRMVVVGANYAAGQEEAAAFRELYERAGGKVVGDTIFLPFPTAPDYQPYVSQIQAQVRSGDAKAVWIFPNSGTEAIKFVRTYSQLGLKTPLIGANNLVQPDSVLEALGQDAVGIRTFTVWHKRLRNSENQRFLAFYKRLFGGEPPADWAALGYTAAQFLDLALRRIKGETRSKNRVVQAMERVGTWLSPTGRVTMDPSTHNIVRPIYLQEVVAKGRDVELQLRATLGIFKDPGR